MPYASDAQRRKFHAMLNRGEISGAVVREFDAASKGLDLPERTAKNAAHEARLDKIAEMAATNAIGSFGGFKAPSSPTSSSGPKLPTPAAGLGKVKGPSLPAPPSMLVNANSAAQAFGQGLGQMAIETPNRRLDGNAFVPSTTMPRV